MNNGLGKEACHRLHADGAARGNPGPAAYGYVLDSPAGEEIASGAEVIGVTTNNVAEYRGLISGLTRALDLGVTRLETRMDSELVVRQMTGRYRVKHPGLVPLFRKARTLADRFEAWSIEHVPRAENKRADLLANRALDEAGARAGRSGMESAR
jgi:ribonuclease HI